ncbi:MAG: tyrosine-type recombinase/integrase [Pseudonocardiales bacterium]|nr:tyrosine-type recombinase/integrase [Pseudonocardiales bacterium]MBV9730061.1 tyrosine-type recombinase/integrase [Pseudonocardiales bacterium]
MTRAASRQKRQRGSIDELPSGALRVRVYAGIDPVTKRRHDLIEIIPAGPDAERRAEDARIRLLAEVQERRNPRTSATVNQLLDRYLALHDGGKTTLHTYRTYAEKHVRPFIGNVKVGALEADVVDSLYAELRRCRQHCNGRPFVEHRITGEHDCDQRCGPHQCKPLAAATIRQIHFLLSGAYNRAIKWRWVSRNPISQAEPPGSPSPDPDPPKSAEAAQLLREAWKDPDWGTLVWLAMTTGARRGELCALRWKHVDLTIGVLTLRRSIAQDGTETEEKDTKTHQRRHVTLDPDTISVLTDHWNRCEARAAELGVKLSNEAFVFSNVPDGSTHLLPSSVTQRYRRMAERIGIDTHLHNLRHYSATELIAAGVDIRTVAGRLGHSGGGTTTLRVYAAWIAEADQRAAAGLASRLPNRPTAQLDGIERVLAEPRAPYEQIAVELRSAILDGKYAAGELLPTIKQLAEIYQVATGTAHRALSLLTDWGLIDVSRGQRAIVRLSAPLATELVQPQTASETDQHPNDSDDAAKTAPRMWEIILRGPDGRRYPRRHAYADINQPDSFRGHMLAIARIEAPTETDDGDSWINNYELEIAEPGGNEPKLVLRW